MDFNDAVNLITDLGVIGLLIFIIFAGVKRWWVWGWQYNDMKERCEAEITFWRNASLRALNVSESVTGRLDRE